MCSLVDERDSVYGAYCVLFKGFGVPLLVSAWVL